MEIITGYFISRGPAEETQEYLRTRGFKGKISIIGQNNQEDFTETNNMTNNTDYILGAYSYGFGGGPTELSNSVNMTRTAPLFSVGSFAGAVEAISDGGLSDIINRWRIPKKNVDEIKSVIETGNTVIFIKSEEDEKKFVLDTLQEKGAQNIHSQLNN